MAGRDEAPIPTNAEMAEFWAHNENFILDTRHMSGRELLQFAIGLGLRPELLVDDKGKGKGKPGRRRVPTAKAPSKGKGKGKDKDKDKDKGKDKARSRSR